MARSLSGHGILLVLLLLQLMMAAVSEKDDLALVWPLLGILVVCVVMVVEIGGGINLGEQGLLGFE